MQLGTRWNVGGQPPGNLPESVLVAIREVEDELAGESVDTALWRWTLTWLERRPIVELDDGTTIRLASDGRATVVNPHQE
ncbi:hypothetical protein [Curtobacterium ammoniigenes]|uniref:hypothetical protein n=1 Tax=Curtobacterium ammoniigenes TaxID=395387 RepID=UPI00082AB361|nr:hypothetical protein [Curtobacterium ammoniigenes]